MLITHARGGIGTVYNPEGMRHRCDIPGVALVVAALVAAGVAAAAGVEVVTGAEGEGLVDAAVGVALGVGAGVAETATGAADVAGTTGGAGLEAAGRMMTRVLEDEPAGDVVSAPATAEATAAAAMVTG